MPSSTRSRAWLCWFALAAGSASASEVPLVRQLTVDSSFAGVSALAAGDLDGDGILDLVGAAETAGDLAWWQGSEAAIAFGYLPASTIDASFDGAKAIALGDVDGDGDLDVVAAATTDTELAWWANDGNGGGWIKDVIAGGASEVRGVALADVDGDGTLDVVGVGGDAVRWFSNDAGDGSTWTGAAIAASPTFGGARAVAAGDLDDDGDVDVAAAAETAGDVAWFENGSAGTTWTRHDLDTTFPQANAVAVADVDGDGSLDVVAVTDNPPDGDVAWWEIPAGTAHPIGEVVGAASVAVADVDGDGDQDVAVGGDGTAPVADVVWLENTAGDGTAFTQRPVDDAFPQTFALVAADLDGDGDVDLGGGSFAQGDVAWWSNETVHGSALFRQRVTVAQFASRPIELAAGDLDGDGDLDLVTGHLAAGGGLDPRAVWLENVGGPFGTFVEHDVDSTFETPGGWSAADVDADGDLDVVAAYGSPVSGRVSWYENDGTPGAGEWTEHVIDGDPTALASPATVAVGDLDGDGTLDVVAALRGDDAVAWYSNDAGDGTSWTRTDVDAAYESPDTVRLADLDGDGRLDVLSASAVLSIATWWEDVSVAGDGSLWTERTIDTPTGALTLDVADSDEDGDLDVFIGASGNTVKRCLNGGDATSWSCIFYDLAGSGAVRHVEVADLDRDGDLDTALFSAGESSGRFRWVDTRPVQDTKVDVDLAFAEAEGMVVADLDGDGDLDVAGLSNCADGGCSPVAELVAWENAGGQFSLATTDIAPGQIASGGAAEVLRIDARHLGRDGFSAPADSNVELTSLELLFEETGGDPLTALELGALVESVEVWLDDEGAGTLDAFDGEDDLVATVDGPFTLSAGVLSVPFASGDPMVLLEPDEAVTAQAIENVRTYFVVAALAADAGLQTPASFQVTHLTESSSTAQDATALVPVRLEWAADVGTGVVAAGPAGLPDHLLIQNETLTGTDTREACLTITADTAVVVQAGADVVFRAADQVILGNGFSVESTASFVVDLSSPAACP